MNDDICSGHFLDRHPAVVAHLGGAVLAKGLGKREMMLCSGTWTLASARPLMAYSTAGERSHVVCDLMTIDS